MHSLLCDVRPAIYEVATTLKRSYSVLRVAINAGVAKKLVGVGREVRFDVLYKRNESCFNVMGTTTLFLRERASKVSSFSKEQRCVTDDSITRLTTIDN